MSRNRKTSKRRRKRRGRSNIKAVLAILILVIIVVVVAVMMIHSRSPDDQSVSSDAEDVVSSVSDIEDDEETEGILPEVEESAALTLSSVYTSSIPNPDCEGEYAENIASLEVTNSSDNYLVHAALTATMSDGTEVYFTVSDLPARATAEIFDTENQTLDSDVTCTSLVCTSEEYTDEDVLMSDMIEVTVSGSDAIITNMGDSGLTNLTVVYHCDMAGQYLGGTSYTTMIDSLAAGESYTLSDDTLMGEVAAVRIYQ